MIAQPAYALLNTNGTCYPLNARHAGRLRQPLNRQALVDERDDDGQRALRADIHEPTLWGTGCSVGFWQHVGWW